MNFAGDEMGAAVLGVITGAVLDRVVATGQHGVSCAGLQCPRRRPGDDRALRQVVKNHEGPPKPVAVDPPKTAG